MKKEWKVRNWIDPEIWQMITWLSVILWCIAVAFFIVLTAVALQFSFAAVRGLVTFALLFLVWLAITVKREIVKDDERF